MSNGTLLSEALARYRADAELEGPHDRNTSTLDDDTTQHALRLLTAQFGSAVGSIHNPGDMIDGVYLASGQSGLNYDFGELLPASISGQV